MASPSFRIITPKYLKPESCRNCALEVIGEGFSIPEGSGSLGVLLVGEALGDNEKKEGTPFVTYAQAGKVLERAITQCGYSRDQFGLFNVIACQPPGNVLLGAPYEYAAIEHCRVHLREVIAAYQPRVILALGAIPLRSLSKLSGKKQNLDMIRGFMLDAPEFPGIPVIGTYHPSYIARGNSNVYPVLCRDLKFAVQCAQDMPAKPDLHYIENGGAYELRKLIELCEKDPETLLSVDFESTGKDSILELMDEGDDGGKKKLKKTSKISTSQEITQVNLAVESTRAMAFGFHGDSRSLMRELLAMGNPKVGHNIWMFDEPVAAFNGTPMGGCIDDTLWMFHHLYPDLPGKGNKVADDRPDGSLANLQFCASFYGFPFPWKHLSEATPEFYGCCDAHSALDLYWGLRHDMERLRRDSEHRSVWDSYVDLVWRIMPIFRKMQAHGIPVSREKLIAFRSLMRGEQAKVQQLIDSCVPGGLLVPHPKTGFKRTPADTEGMILREFAVPGGENKCSCFKIRKKDLLFWSELPTSIVDEKGRLRAPEPNCEMCKGVGYYDTVDSIEKRWCRLKPFNVQSQDQMKAYAAYQHHKIPKNSKKKIAMDDETLQRLLKSTGDELYGHAREKRGMKKMETTYADGWMPDADGFLRTQFSFLPATMQHSSVGPNVQNAPNISKQPSGSSKRAIAVAFNEAVEAKDGYVLVELDFKSFHAQTLGLEAGDMSYIRLAKIDAHSYLACHMLKIPEAKVALSWSDDDLRAWLKWHCKNYVLKNGDPFEKLRNKQAKPGILGYGFGMGYEKLYALNEDSFDSQNEAKHVFDVLNGEFPITAKFRDTIPLVAKKQGGKLISAFGSVRWFWDIQSTEYRRGQLIKVHGKDWEKAIAFLPATDAFGHKKLAMIAVDDAGVTERFGMHNDVHDALKFHCPVGLLHEHVHTVKEIMERPSDVLVMPNGEPFSCEVEAKVGKTWAQMEDYTA